MGVPGTCGRGPCIRPALISPLASDEDLRIEAAKIVADLLSIELVELYYSQEPYGEMSRIFVDEAFELLGTDDV